MGFTKETCLRLCLASLRWFCAINRGFLRACCGYIRFSMRPCVSLKNPDLLKKLRLRLVFSSQNKRSAVSLENKGHRSALADVSLEILESTFDINRPNSVIASLAPQGVAIHKTKTLESTFVFLLWKAWATPRNDGEKLESTFATLRLFLCHCERIYRAAQQGAAAASLVIHSICDKHNMCLLLFVSLGEVA